MKIKNYMQILKEFKPYIVSSAKETLKDVIYMGIGGILTIAVLIGGDLLLENYYSNNLKTEYKIWNVKKEGESITIEKKVNPSGYIKLIHKQSDGEIDTNLEK